MAAPVLRVRVRAPIRPSEDPAKVEQAVRHLFPNASYDRRPDEIEATADTLQDLRNVIWRQRILDASRRSLLRSLEPDGAHARFRLNKQAAYKGRLSFSEELASPLGDIEVVVEGEGLEPLFKEIAPMTIRGHPVSEERAEKEIAKRRKRKAALAPVEDLKRELATDEEEEALDDELDEEADGAEDADESEDEGEE